MDVVDRSRLIGLVSGTMAMTLELQDRPMMLDAVNLSLDKIPESKDTDLDRCSLRFTQARLLEVLDRHGEALRVLDDAMGTAGQAGKFQLSRLRDHLGLVGTAAPSIESSQTIGGFSGLEAWRGKVVILDFFADWCKPCIAEFKEMKGLYSENHGKGLEILGMTQYYGYFGTRKGISKDEEFQAMEGFRRDQELPWPVAYVPAAVTEKYRMLALPNLVVVDRKGIVREVGFGFYPEAGKLRSLVDRLIAE